MDQLLSDTYCNWKAEKSYCKHADHERYFNLRLYFSKTVYCFQYLPWEILSIIEKVTKEYTFDNYATGKFCWICESKIKYIYKHMENRKMYR